MAAYPAVGPAEAMGMRFDLVMRLLGAKADLMERLTRKRRGVEAIDVNGGIEDLKRKLGIG